MANDLSVRNTTGNKTSRRFVPSSRWKLYLEHIRGDEALPLLVVDPECLLQLLLHLLLVILDQELGGHLDRGRWVYLVCIIFSRFLPLATVPLNIQEDLTKHGEVEFAGVLLIHLS